MNIRRGMFRMWVCSSVLWVAGGETVESAGAENYTSVGMGNSSCEEWLSDRRDDVILDIQDRQWVWGFLSGIGLSNDVIKDPLATARNGNAVVAWIDIWCATHPLDRISDAAVAFAIDSTRHHHTSGNMP